MLKLSIIVPVYNVEQYLAKCIDSLLRQDLASEEYEVVLVDDGSTDNSGRIADTEGLRTEEKGLRTEEKGLRTEEKGLRKEAYVKPSTGYIEAEDYKTPRIRVIHQPNMGLSAARNAGLRIAEGKYVQFVDSDDFLEPNVLGGLVRQMESQELDVLRFDYQCVRLACSEERGAISEDSRESRVESREYEVYWPYKREKLVDRKQELVDGETYLNERMPQACFAWQFVVKRELLVSNDNVNDNDNCFFQEGLYYEDTEWTPRMLLRAERVGATTMVVYNYLQREGSITKAIDEQIRKREVETKLYLIDATKRILVQGKAVDWCKGMIADLVISSFGVMIERDWGRRKEYLKQLEERNVIPLSSERLDKRRARKAKLINISPWLYAYIMRIVSKR